MEDDKDIQKKTRVFHILDDLKERGEKINADKLAKLAQMGKQTVLPYYNEWRFLDETQQQVESELPQDLVRSLQRLLIQWRNDVTKAVADVRDQASCAQAELSDTVHQLSEEKVSLEQANHQLQQNNEALSASLREKNRHTQQLEQEISNSVHEKAMQAQQIQSLQSAADAMKQEHAEALATQEAKLDQQYSRQVDHWMKSLDEERVQKQALQKDYQLLHAQLLAAEKEKNLFEQKAMLKVQALNEANQTIGELQKNTDDVQPALEVLVQVKNLLQTSLENTVTALSSLLDQKKEIPIFQQKIKDSAQRITDLEVSLSDKESQLLEQHSLTLALEKSRGYGLAMEKALAQAVKADKE